MKYKLNKCVVRR